MTPAMHALGFGLGAMAERMAGALSHTADTTVSTADTTALSADAA